MRAALFLIGIFWVAGTLHARAKSDVVVMNNGDRFTCEIKKLERGVLYASFDYVDGTMSIQWSKVARIESTQLFIVNTLDGSIYEGTIHSSQAEGEQPVKLEVLEPTQNLASTSRRDVVEISQSAQSFWKRISGNIDSGLIYTRGNDTTQYNVGAGLRLRHELWQGELDIVSTLSKSAELSAATRNQARLGARRYIGGRRRWFYSGASEFLQSSQQGISLQSTLGGGIGKLLKDTNNARFSLTGGLAYQSTRYDLRTSRLSPPNALAGMVSMDLHLFHFKKTTFDLSASALPVLTEPGRIRTYVNSAYSVQIISNLWIKFSFYGNWDNRPPIYLSGSDYGASSGVSWSFN